MELLHALDLGENHLVEAETSPHALCLHNSALISFD